MKIRTKVEVTIGIIFIILISLQAYAVIILNAPQTPRDFTSDGVYYHNSGGNAYFTTNQSMGFQQIVLDASYVKFNTTGFYVESPNQVNISLVYINENILTATDGEKVLEFWVNTSTGNVFFNISGMKGNSNYVITQDGGAYTTNTTNASGYITFNSTDWTEHRFEITYETQGAFSIASPYPVNACTGTSRPPENISISATGTGFDVYIYYTNMTTGVNTTTLMDVWYGQTTGRFEVNTSNYTTELIVGDTTYYWTVNATNGSEWSNASYSYKTGGSRFDVENSGDIVATDVIVTWNNRTGEKAYDVIYDVDWSSDITATDCTEIWANRT